MIRPQRSITINSYIVEHETLAIIGNITREFENVGDSWKGIDMDFSIQNRRRTPYTIPKTITNALIKLFQTIANRRRIFDETVDASDDGCDKSAKHDDKLRLEIGPTIFDDENFRAMIGTAIQTMILMDLKIHGYGNFHPKGTIGNSSFVEFAQNERRQPSLWDCVETSDSLEKIRVYVHGPDEVGDIDNYLPSKSHRLPRLWEAIQRNKSLSSLEVHLYCHLYERKEKEEMLTILQRLDTLSTMESLSQSLKWHASIRKLDLRYRSDVHQQSLLVPHATDIMEGGTIRDFKIERFSFYVTNEDLRFPMTEFNEALSKSYGTRFMDIDSDTDGISRKELETLEFSNVGMTDDQAKELLKRLPNSVKTLDISQNRLEYCPMATKKHNSSKLTELVLWKNPCLYNNDQESSLRQLLSLMMKYPCLKDFGPWDKWQFQTKVDYLYLKLEVSPSLRNAHDRVHAIADQNRCQTFFLPRRSVLVDNLSLWPLFLSQIPNLLEPKKRDPRRNLMGASTKSIEERQANVMFAFLRENVSGGIFTRV